jgi:site-specific recombinase XerD
MLGHKSIRSTQVYTKVVNQLKREATNRIKLDM